MNSYARFGVGIMLSTLATLVGCQATCDDGKFFKTQDDRMSAGDQVSAYFSDVGKDFMDIFTLGVGAGKAGPLLFHANAHVTKYAELGYGQWAGWTSGMLGRGVGTWREEKHEGGFAFLPIQNYWVSNDRVPCCGNDDLRSKYLDAEGYNINLDNNGHWADVGLSLHLLAVGVDAGVSPYEAMDFVFGLLGNYPNPALASGNAMPWDIGSDIADDDTRVSMYDDKTSRYRHSAYSIWPTIWPTTYGHHEEIEGGEWAVEPKHGKHTGSWGGAFGGANAHCAPGIECKHNPACKN
ncbi:MAG: hypothetical protein IT459_11495 [Planctomycetes bacterium]|nr:hypothetical protein [Planctomycetota bacterium]